MAELIPSLRPTGVGVAPSIQEGRAQDSAMDAQAKQDAPTLGQTWDAAKRRNFLYKSLDEVSSRARAPVDPNFTVTEDQLKELAREYSQRELDVLAGSASQLDYDNRIKGIQQDRDNLQTIQRAGLTGIGAEIAASLVDPTMLPLLIGTGGAAGAAKVSMLARTIRAAGAGAVVAGGTEAGLMQADTTKDWDDVLLSAVTGGAVSGAVPAVARAISRRGGQPAGSVYVERDRENWDHAVVQDGELRRTAQAVREANMGDDVQALLDNPSIVNRDSRAALIEELQPEAAQRMSRGDRRAVEQRMSELEYGIRQEQASLRSETLNVADAGTNRLRRERAQANSARVAEHDQRVAPLREELERLRSRQAEDQRFRDAEADISRLVQGIIPDRLRARFQELEDARIGPRGQAERAHVEAKASAERAAREASPEPQPGVLSQDSPSPAQEQPISTAGAAQVQGAKFEDEMHLVNEQADIWQPIEDGIRLAERSPRNWDLHLFPGRALKDRAISSYSTIDAAPTDMIRGLNIKLNANPQAGLKGHIPAAHYQDMYMRRAFDAEGGLEREGALEYAKANKIPAWKFELGISDARREFDNLVVLHMRGKRTSNDPAIQKAAKGRAKMLESSLKARQDAGVRGFEEITHDSRYFPFVMDTSKMQAAYRMHGEQAVEDLLTGSYRAGRMKLSERAARIVARAQMRRTLDKGLDTQAGTNPIFTAKNIGFLKEELETLGLGKQQVDDMLADMQQATLNESVSKRAKFSLGASISHSSGELRMVDLIDTSQDVVLNYAREGAGEAALARQGFRTRREADMAIDEAVRDSRNLLQTELRDAQASGDKNRVDALTDALGSNNSGRLGLYQEMLHDSVRQIMGESLDAMDGTLAKGGIRFSRALRKATGILRLGWNGFASISEASNSLISFGIGTVLRNVPKTRWIQMGKYKDRVELEALHSIMGAYGHKENYFLSKNYAAANMGEDASSRMERIYNNAAGWVQDKNMLISFFRTVQNGGEELAQRSMLDRLMRAADGSLKFNKKDLAMWRESGLEDSEFEDVLRYIRENPEYVEVDGIRSKVFSADSMDPELRDRLGAAMTSILGRQMQRNFVGETSIWVNKEVGKLITQFRTFSLVSLEKQLAYGIRGDKAVLAQRVLLSTFMGYMAYMTRVQLQAAGKDDPQEYIDKSTSGPALAIGVMNMNNIYGGLGLGLDGLATVGALPSGWMSGNKSWGFQGYGTDAVPFAGVIGDAVGATSATSSMLRSLLSGEGIEDEDREKAFKKMMRMVPLVNSAAIGTALAVVNGGR